MDFYISDSMQDIYDIDIRSEVETVVGGANELSSLVNFDLPPLDLDSNSNDVWMGSSRWSFGSTSDIYADVGECVNPNAVMPSSKERSVMANVSVLLKSPKEHLNLNRHHMFDALLTSPSEKKSHLTFSPATIKLSQMKQEQSTINNSSVKRLMSINTIESNRENVKKDLSNELSGSRMPNKIKFTSELGGITFADQNGHKFDKTHLKVLDNTIYSINKNHKLLQRSASPKMTFSGLKPHNVKNVIHPSRAINGYTNGYFTSEKPTKKSKQNHPIAISEFPKPAYSYSCLIAMALKNSRSGSLPVSEIYNFMCQHFPYFKTAPNGWKNSVRHNLSLNKCFEKIEKPISSGGQRKGCLWAMNPAKILKMDEEVQKWSRKDPMAIKKAMVFPEHLESLERGEMKHGPSGDTDDEMEEENEEEDEQEEQSFMNTPESLNDGQATSDEDVDFDVEVS